MGISHSPFDTTPDMPAGTMVGEYRVVAKLSEGGMGEVYAGVHPLIDKKVAIKVIRPSLGLDDVAVDRFVQEARVVNQIGHPNIVDIFAFGELPDSRAYFVMEWLAGETLAERMIRQRPDLDEALRVLDQIADALDAAHEKGVVHRDLKPENVFVVPTRGGHDRVKLVDFGLAKLAGVGADLRQEVTEPGLIMGTPAYMSPEQARGKGVGPPTDIYALGCLAFELFVGQLPFEADTTADLIEKHLFEEPPSPCLLWPEVPMALERLLLAMLDKDAERRPTPAEIRETLRELGLERSMPPASWSRPPTNPVVIMPAPIVVRPEPVLIQTLPPAAPRSRAPLVAAAAIAALGSLGLVWMTRSAPAPAATPPPVTVAVPVPRPLPAPPPLPVPRAPAPLLLAIRVNVPARIEVGGALVAEAAEHIELPVVAGGEHRLVVSARGHQTVERLVAGEAGARVEVPVRLEPVRPRDTVSPRVREGRALRQEGLRQARARAYAAALAAYGRAYDLAPEPVLLLDMARAHQQRGDKVQARRLYRAYLIEVPSARNRAEIEEIIRVLE